MHNIYICVYIFINIYLTNGWTLRYKTLLIYWPVLSLPLSNILNLFFFEIITYAIYSPRTFYLFSNSPNSILILGSGQVTLPWRGFPQHPRPCNHLSLNSEALAVCTIQLWIYPKFRCWCALLFIASFRRDDSSSLTLSVLFLTLCQVLASGVCVLFIHALFIYLFNTLI